mmetsp:Transcript_5212/g.19505  ORF Transcript_5212/g.19505 Transcript_5212/m.19505 type:complete len:89 (+) Transcript_5212:2827-3093(+)
MSLCAHARCNCVPWDKIENGEALLLSKPVASKHPPQVTASWTTSPKFLIKFLQCLSQSISPFFPSQCFHEFFLFTKRSTQQKIFLSTS